MSCRLGRNQCGRSHTIIHVSRTYLAHHELESVVVIIVVIIIIIIIIIVVIIIIIIIGLQLRQHESPWLLAVMPFCLQAKS